MGRLGENGECLSRRTDDPRNAGSARVRLIVRLASNAIPAYCKDAATMARSGQTENTMAASSKLMITGGRAPLSMPD